MTRIRLNIIVATALCLVIIVLAAMGMGSAGARLPGSQTANVDTPLMAATYTGMEPVREVAWPIGKRNYPGSRVGGSQLVEVSAAGTRIAASAGHDASYSLSQVFSSGRLAQFSH